MTRLLAAVGGVLICIIAAAWLYAYAGFYDVGASRPELSIVRQAMDEVVERSVARHADPRIAAAPALDSRQLLRDGARHYRESGCIQCHGGPGVAKAKFALYMRPEPPALTIAAARWTDAELYWIIEHGIRMTGMPAFGPSHSVGEMWALVAFVRQLPKMSSAEFEATASGQRP